MMTLIKRELGRFFKRPVVFLNLGFGIIIMLVLTAAAFIKADYFRTGLIASMNNSGMKLLLPVVCVMVVIFLLTLDSLTASSISLEGGGLYPLVSEYGAKAVLDAKAITQVILNAIPAVLTQLALGYLIEADAVQIVLMALCSVLFIPMHAEFGLMMNLKRPMLEWEHEAIPIKQSMPTMSTMLFGWAWVIGFAALGRIMMDFLDPTMMLMILAGLELVGLVISVLRVRTKGVELLEEIVRQ